MAPPARPHTASWRAVAPTGRNDILDQHVFERVPVLFVCFEDGETELKRRICAAMLEHGVSNNDIKGYLFVRAITDSELKLATGDDYNKAERGPLIAAIARRHVGTVFLDPLVKTHAVNENSNTAMDLVIGILAELVIRHDVPLDAPQHVSKGLPDPGNPDRGRGASAVKDGGRLVCTLCGMSAAEAAAFSLDPDERFSYVRVRVDPAKLDLVRGGGRPKWFRLVGVPLGNTWDPRYPHDTLKPWTPPDPFEDTQRSQLAKVFTRFRSRLGNGEFHTLHAGGAKTRWAGKVIMEVMGKSDAETSMMLAAWKKSKTLTETLYRSPNNHDNAKRTVADETKAQEILGHSISRRNRPADPSPGKPGNPPYPLLVPYELSVCNL
jgi:AAA domain